MYFGEEKRHDGGGGGGGGVREVGMPVFTIASAGCDHAPKLGWHFDESREMPPDVNQ